jgi:hypothetical protein
VDFDWGPLLATAFSDGGGIKTQAQRRFLGTLVEKAELWDPKFGNAFKWFKQAGLPYDRQVCSTRAREAWKGQRRDAVVRIRDSKEADGKDIRLGGGGDPATALFSEIDDLIRKVNPPVLGAGTPLLGGAVKQIGVERTGSKIYGNGFMLRHS